MNITIREIFFFLKKIQIHNFGTSLFLSIVSLFILLWKKQSAVRDKSLREICRHRWEEAQRSIDQINWSVSHHRSLWTFANLTSAFSLFLSLSTKNFSSHKAMCCIGNSFNCYQSYHVIIIIVVNILQWFH